MEKSITSPEYAQFLRQLRAARRRAGLTQAELAARVGETQSFISKCERGERRLDVIELRTFCRAFGIPVRRFVEHLDRALLDNEKSRLGKGRRTRRKASGTR